MRNRRIRILAALLTLGATSVVSIALASPASAAVPGQIVITEWMYNPRLSASEFVEVTNIGGEPVDMAGYSFDDDSHIAGTFPLAAWRTLAPGESGLIVEGTAAAFRTEWGLAAASRSPPATPPTSAATTRSTSSTAPRSPTGSTYGDQNFAGLDPHPRHLGRSHVVRSARRERRRRVGALGGR